MKSTMKLRIVNFADIFPKITQLVWEGLHELLKAKVYWGRSPAGLPLGSLVFFPLQPNVLGCGIAAIVCIIANLIYRNLP